MELGFELFDHTADLGIRVFTPSLAELVAVSAEALYAAIGELKTQGAPQTETFRFTGEDRAVLLRDYLAELLLLFERDHRMVTQARVIRFDAGRLEVSGESRAVNRSKSLFDREVKAVTYHGLKLEEIEGGYLAEYIVDI